MLPSVSCCWGTMLSTSVYSVLLLFLCGCTGVSAVCTSCFGSASGCTGDPATCPWATAVAGNVAAVAAAGAAAKVALDKILPPKYVRLFSRKVLQALTMINTRPVGGASFDFTGKSPAQIRDAVVHGHVSREDALIELSDRADAITLDDTQYDRKAKQLELIINVVKVATPQVASSQGLDGCFMFVLGKLSTVLCGSKSISFDLCMEVDASSSAPGPSSSAKFSTSLTRPKCMAQCYSLLHNFVVVSAATGIGSTMALVPFLDDVVYEPVRTEKIEWPVAFEMLVLYLRKVEAEPTAYNVTNVVVKMGGMDAMRKQARQIAQGMYSPGFFRSPGGNPGNVKRDDDEGNKEYGSEVQKFNKNSKKGCSAFNLGTPHLRKHVDANGVCKFFHGCDHFVTDKGPNGQCLSVDHKREQCDYDESKKCSKPVRK